MKKIEKESINNLIRLLERLEKDQKRGCGTVSVQSYLQIFSGEKEKIIAAREFLESLLNSSNQEDKVQDWEVDAPDEKIEREKFANDQDKKMDFEKKETNAIMSKILQNISFKQKIAENVVDLLIKDKEFIEKLAKQSEEILQKEFLKASVTNQNITPKKTEDIVEENMAIQPAESADDQEDRSLSQGMEKLVEEYNRNPRYRQDLKLDLLQDEAKYRSNHLPEDTSSSKEIPLQKKQGGGSYYAVLAEDENRFFIVPFKNIRLDKQSIWQRAFDYFFHLDNIERLNSDSKFYLEKPAVVEKRDDRNFYLVEQGFLEIRN